MNTIKLNTLGDKVVIKRGEGGGAVSPKAVNFCDYDGTILHAYSKEEFLALNELPPLPSKEGLICQEWNWDLLKAQAYVEKYGGLIIGASYTTDDGSSRFYMEIPEECRTITIYFSLNNSGYLDWGDGSEQEQYNKINITATHTYAKGGRYVIRFIGGKFDYSHNMNSTGFLGNNDKNNRVYQEMLKKIELGDNITDLSYYGALYCTGLESISIPNTITELRNYAFNYNYALKFLALPKNLVSRWQYSINYAYSLTNISLGQSFAIGSTDVFAYCQRLRSIYLPDGMKAIQNYTFRACYALTRILIPSSVNSISKGGFYDCAGLRIVDFSKHEAIPTLSNTNAFSGIHSDCKIIVPDALYDTWIAATNWSTYASYIIKKSDWDASQS